MKQQLLRTAETLNKNDQKNIKAGLMDSPRYKSCSCIGGPGSWTYTAPGGVSADIAKQDIKDYCQSGAGTCERA